MSWARCEWSCRSSLVRSCRLVRLFCVARSASVINPLRFSASVALIGAIIASKSRILQRDKIGWPVNGGVRQGADVR